MTLIHKATGKKVTTIGSHNNYIVGLVYYVIDENGNEWIVNESDIGRLWTIAE